MDPAAHLSAFGLQQFRPGQLDVIQAVLHGRDCLCVMPTGGGKSLCYQLPAVARAGIVLVVSPLIALMKDQVDGLRQRGVRAACLNSTMEFSEQEQTLQQAEAGQFDLLYVAPERFRSGRFQAALGRLEVQLLAIDEAHCISEWGHDFRPDYARLGRLRRALGQPPTIALTATATQHVRDDIIAQLELREPEIFVTGFARDNLAFSVQIANGQTEKEWLLLSELEQLGDGGAIVYCNTRKNCEAVSEMLSQQLSRPVSMYHAGLAPDDRNLVQEAFMSGDTDVIVATNAFGMGIDRSDLRLVVHYNVPGSLEAYYQEAGRAGRDGLPARCVLLFGYQDRYIHEFFIENAHPSRELLRDVYEYLRSLPQDPIEITQQELKEQLCLKTGPESVGAAEQVLERSGAVRRLSSQQNRASIWLDTDSPSLVDLLPREAKVQRKVMAAVEKLAGDVRYERATVTVEQLLAASGLEREALNRALRELSKLKWFDYAPPFRGRAIHIVDPQAPFARLEIDFAELERRKQSEYAKLERMMQYAQSRRCRQVEFLSYFGQSQQSACGQCDNCTRSGQTRPTPTFGEVSAEKISRAVQMALSGVARAKGRFGKNTVAQMLCGSQSAKLSKWRLDRLSTFGLFRQCTQAEVNLLLDELIRVGAVEQLEVDRFRPVIQLTEFGGEVMRGQAPLNTLLRLEPATAAKLGALDRSAGEPAPGAAAALSDCVENFGPAPGPDDPPPDGADRDGEEEARLTERLRQWRRETAEGQGIPAFRVLTNAVIERLVRQRPASSEELAGINGVGDATMAQYGAALLHLLGGDEPTSRREETPTPRTRVEPSSAQHGPPPPHCWTCRLLADGYSVQECLQIRRLNAEDVLSELEAAAAAALVQPGWLEELSPLLPENCLARLARLRKSLRAAADSEAV